MNANVAVIAERLRHGSVGRGQLVEHVPGPVDQGAPEHLPGAQVDEVPVVDPVVPAEIEGGEGLELLVRRRPRLGLLRHDPHRAGADLVRLVLEQSLDLVELHVHEVAGRGEDGAHPHADELLVALRKVPPVLQALVLGRFALEPRDEGVRAGVGRVGGHSRPRERVGTVERETGFEPATFCLGSRHSAS